MSEKEFETVSGDVVGLSLHEDKWIELMVDDDPAGPPAKTFLDPANALRLAAMLGAAVRELDKRGS